MGHGFNSWWPQLNIIMRTGWNLTKVSSAPDNSNSSGNILNSDNFADHLFTGGFHSKSREVEVATFVGFAAKSIYFARQFTLCILEGCLSCRRTKWTDWVSFKFEFKF